LIAIEPLAPMNGVALEMIALASLCNAERYCKCQLFVANLCF
jgi:hypothetical protein